MPATLLYEWSRRPNLIRVAGRAFVCLSVVEILVEALISTCDGDAIVVSEVPCLLVQTGKILPDLKGFKSSDEFLLFV